MKRKAGVVGIIVTVVAVAFAAMNVSAAEGDNNAAAPLAGDGAVAAAAAPKIGDPGVLPSVDFAKLETQAIKQWGVVGSGNSFTAPKSQVWDFEEIGNTIYVAGIFTGVQRNGDDPSSTVQSQAYLAAFDRDSGEWRSSFTPTFNRAVYALAVAPDGNLLVGGEFTTVNGASRTGLVKLDPATGATIAAFPTYISAGSQPMVRDILVDGQDVYIAGQMSNVYGPNGAPWVWNATRINATTGAIDLNFLPRYMGGVWQLALDKTRGRVHAAGFFTSVAGQSGTASFASVTAATGAYISGLTAFEHNEPNGQRDTVAVVYGDDKIYVGGAQHIVQVLNADTNARIGYVTSGLACNNFSPSCGYTGGGDYQVLEMLDGGTVMGGCHCYAANSIYSSLSNARTNQTFAHGIRTSDGSVPAWSPALKQRSYGTYSIFVDSNHCVYIGGDYIRRADGSWLGGFGRFCEPVVAPTALEASRSSNGVRLSWTPTDSPLPIAYYKVYRNGTFAGDTTGTSFGFSNLPIGSTQQYTVRAMDVAGRLSAEAKLSAVVPDADALAPTVPGNATAALDGTTVTLTWDASVDLPNPGGVGVSGYLIHRDWNFIKFVAAGTHTFIDSNVAVGPRRYEIRAVDFGNHMSAPAVVNVNVGGVVDTLAPTVPGNAIAALDGTTVTLSWDASVDLPNPGGVGVSGYLIHRDWNFIKFVAAGTHTFVDSNVAVGPRRYEIRAVDLGNRMSEPAVVNANVGGIVDNEAPTVPTNVAASVSGTSVTLTWGASSDLPNPGGVGLSGYLIHRNWDFLKFVPAGTLTYVDTNVAAGNQRYEVRSVDLGNRISAPASPVVVTVGG